MTWEQLRGLNYATMGRSVRGNLWIDGERTGRAWHLPPDTWRLENAAGEPTVVETAAEEFRRAADGVMVHAIKAGTTRVVATVGTPPWRLLTGYSQWPPPSSLPEAPALEPVGAPRQVEVRGRRGWEMLFAAAGTGQEVRCVIDAETGVVLRRSTAVEVVEVSDPVLDERFDPALFTWTGPVRAERDQLDALRREHEEKARRLAELPRTGAIDLWVSLRGPTLILRQWLTEVGEPEPDFGVGRMPVRHRGTRGPRTFELRGHDPLDPADGARIIDSLDLPTPPATPPARLRAIVEREAAAAAEAELGEVLGTGRRLDDHLGGGHGSLLVRTAFGDEEAWRAVAAAAMTPGGGPDGDVGDREQSLAVQPRLRRLRPRRRPGRHLPPSMTERGSPHPPASTTGLPLADCVGRFVCGKRVR